MIWGIIGIPFSLSVLVMWYCETYTDSQFGKNARFISSATRMSDKSQSIGTFLLASFVTIGNEAKFPQFIQLALIAMALIIITTGIVYYFSALPVPRWANARYQYLKRHGMLDENGDPLPAVRAFGGRRGAC